MDKGYAIPLLPFSKIIDLELLSKNIGSRRFPFCEWHEILTVDDDTFSASDVEAHAKKALLAHLNNIPSINERRQERAKYILRGKFRADQLRNLLGPNQEMLLREAQLKLPEIAPIFGPGGLFDAILRKVNHDKFRVLALETLLHPTVLAKLSFHPEFEVKPISNFFWDQANKLVDIIAAQIIHSVRIQSNLELDFKKFNDALSDYFVSREFFQETLTKMNSGLSVSPSLAPGTKNLLGMIAQLTLKKLKAHADPAKKIDYLRAPRLRQGDFGDAMHSIYQPYVDIFCCDKKTKSLLGKFVTNADNICCSEEDILSRL
jgi:hypothetical protein